MGFLAIQVLSDHTRCAHCTNVGSQESVPKMKMLRKKFLFCGEECQFQVGNVATTVVNSSIHVGPLAPEKYVRFFQQHWC